MEQTLVRFRPLRLSTLLAGVLIAVAASACANTFDATTVGVEASMSSPAATPPQGQPFKVSGKALYFFGGLLPVSRPSLASALNLQVTSTQQVANLKIHVRSRWTDVLITVLTAGIVVPRSVTYEGVVVGK
jgi:hypothetical protein